MARVSLPDFFTPTKHMDALDAHLDLIECLKRPIQAKYWTGLLESQRENASLTPQYQAEPGWEHVSEGAMAAAQEITRLSYSSTYWVAPQVISLVSDNVSLLPEDGRIHPYDLVTQRGFAYLDHPVEILDSKGVMCAIKAISWGVSATQVRAPVEGTNRLGRSPGMVITIYSDLLDPAGDETYAAMGDDYRRQTAAYFGRLQVLVHGIHPWVFSHDLKSDGIPVEFGVGKAMRIQDDMPLDPELTLMLGDDDIGRWVRSFFMVLGDRLVSRVRPGRQIRRRMERRKAPEWGDVRVVDLRRYTERGEVRNRSANDEWWVDWTYRHKVKSHWRRCWVKVEGTDERVPVWRPVKAYIRGPEHLPLIERDDVYRAVR